jgi:hypothetical protein
VDQLTRVVAATIALAGVGLTTVLLVADLKRPERFLSILYRPQRRSWLAIGAFILVGYSGLLGLWWLGTLVGMDDVITPSAAGSGWPSDRPAPCSCPPVRGRDPGRPIVGGPHRPGEILAPPRSSRRSSSSTPRRRW